MMCPYKFCSLRSGCKISVSEYYVECPIFIEAQKRKKR